AGASSTVDSAAAVPSPFMLVAAGVGSESWGGGAARLTLLDRGDEVALAHLRGVRDVQLTRELAELREHHRAQAPAAGGGGGAARGVRGARFGRGTGGDEIGLAHEGPS